MTEDDHLLLLLEELIHDLVWQQEPAHALPIALDAYAAGYRALPYDARLRRPAQVRQWAAEMAEMAYVGRENSADYSTHFDPGPNDP
jgi:hypothetical protein